MSKPATQLYRSFLVRCWLLPPVGQGKAIAWRYELVDVSAEPVGRAFNDLEQLKESMSITLQSFAAGSDPL